MMGSRSRCTPSDDASAPCRSSAEETILSISSMNTMPSCSTAAIASFTTVSWLIMRSNSPSSMCGRHSDTCAAARRSARASARAGGAGGSATRKRAVMRFFSPRARPPMARSTLISISCSGIMPPASGSCSRAGLLGSSTSIMRSSSCPARYSALNVSRTVFSPDSPVSRSRIFASTAAFTCARTHAHAAASAPAYRRP